MKILYVAGECAPFAASGGLGDVIGALPKFVAKQRPNDTVEVILPLYDTIVEKYRKKLTFVCNISLKLSWRNTGAAIYKITEGGVNYYFIENNYYFNRGRLYGEYDDAERFAFFSMAVISFIKSASPPDIIHANDWQCGALPIYLKTAFSADFKLSKIKTLYTIHNIEYQGKFPLNIISDVFGIDEKYRGVLEYDGCINLMKGAIVCADFVNTVSPRYADELKYDFFSFGLSNVISSVSDKMCGVLNGIDYDEFSPENCSDIFVPYGASDLSFGKRKNKLALQMQLGLSCNAEKPLVVMITRLAVGKGIDLVLHVLDELLSLDLEFIILGTGEASYESALKSFERRYENFRAILSFDRALSKKIYAAADLFLMPSKSEPCGLSQMIAASFGTVPIVRSVGGLSDTIIPYDSPGANGFAFDNYNAHELLYTLKFALSVYSDKEKWERLRALAKASDFSWNNSAKKYIAIYENLIKRK